MVQYRMRNIYNSSAVERNSLKYGIMMPPDNYNEVITDLSHILNCDILNSVANINYNYQITQWFRKSNHILSSHSSGLALPSKFQAYTGLLWCTTAYIYWQANIFWSVATKEGSPKLRGQIKNWNPVQYPILSMTYYCVLSFSVPTALSLVNFSTFKRILNHGFKTNGTEQTSIYPAKQANKQFYVSKC